MPPNDFTSDTNIASRLYPWLSDTSELDVSGIKGNVEKQIKQQCVGLLAFFVGAPERHDYGSQIGQRLRFTEIDVWKMGECTYHARTVIEITVEKDMCNIFGILHGACAAYIVDPCTVSSLIVLGIKLGMDGTGLSQSMNLIWHQAIKRGAKIKIVSNCTSVKSKIKTIRCEIFDGDKLCITALHSTIHATMDTVAKM